MDQKGYTIIETMIAIAIFSIGVLGVTLLQISSLRTAQRAIDLTEASARATQVIEELQNERFTHAALQGTGGIAGLDDFPPDQEADFSRTYEDVTVYWNVADGIPVAGAKTVRVMAQWQERGETKQVVFDFLKTQVM